LRPPGGRHGGRRAGDPPTLVADPRAAQAASLAAYAFAFDSPYVSSGHDELREFALPSFEPGRPLLYGTSKEFLELFNLRDLTQLPTLREFQELSEESRKIVEEETPAPSVAGLTELAHDPVVAERLARASVESDAALAQLENAMERAEESTKTTSSVLDPPRPEAAPVVAPQRDTTKAD